MLKKQQYKLIHSHMYSVMFKTIIELTLPRVKFLIIRKQKQIQKKIQFALRFYSLPETRRRPEVKAFKKTTRFPLNLPASKIRTVPGVIDDLTLGGFLTGVGPFFRTTSSAG